MSFNRLSTLFSWNNSNRHFLRSSSWLDFPALLLAYYLRLFVMLVIFLPTAAAVAPLSTSTFLTTALDAKFSLLPPLADLCTITASAIFIQAVPRTYPKPFFPFFLCTGELFIGFIRAGLITLRLTYSSFHIKQCSCFLLFPFGSQRRCRSSNCDSIHWD